MSASVAPTIGSCTGESALEAGVVDTSAWYALADRKDPDHPAAALGQWSGRLVTSNFIMDESVTLIRYRFGHVAAQTFGETLLAGAAARMVAITRQGERRAW